jgi:hypothetical protein
MLGKCPVTLKYMDCKSTSEGNEGIRVSWVVFGRVVANIWKDRMRWWHLVVM